MDARCIMLMHVVKRGRSKGFQNELDQRATMQRAIGVHKVMYMLKICVDIFVHNQLQFWVI